MYDIVASASCDLVINAKGHSLSYSLQIDLEQYATSAHIASHMLFVAESQYEDIAERTVLDLGCGCGILSIASALMGASHVIGIDCDESALETAVSNIDGFDPLPIDLIHGLVTPDRFPLSPKCVDTVVSNPPFGTRRAGADLQFLQLGIQSARRAVYSMHKSSTRSHIQKWLKSQDRVASAKVIAELRFDLPSTYKFHSKKSKDIEVDIWRVDISEED